MTTEAKHRVVLYSSMSDQWGAEYFNWRIKNGKRDTQANREAFQAGFLAGRKAERDAIQAQADA